MPKLDKSRNKSQLDLHQPKKDLWSDLYSTGLNKMKLVEESREMAERVSGRKVIADLVQLNVMLR